ncbi:two-component system, NtrC family, response regulator GlrR [Noviherbaspirillum humi]|uniref:Two-component system, NtrC family, response regulator GlrR n=1 Tax=Noviherbaspirillum humi TaxID=1688639 RepID=A0A239LCQ5_9BURK|nr:sigma-54 dependent transcriptional regulator [Noviherbaspirillum humi]SNT28436.1 two-component system, NtrC family, response regulator GlrR [Noviherbaspirillum humi]
MEKDAGANLGILILLSDRSLAEELSLTAAPALPPFEIAIWQDIDELKRISGTAGAAISVFDIAAQAEPDQLNGSKWLRCMIPEIDIVAVIDSESHDSALKALQHGANHFSRRENLSEVLGSVILERARLGKHQRKAASTDYGIYTRSRALLDLIADVCAVAESRCHILFHGPTGAGKELFARTVHKHSNRCHGPFVALNCAAVPAEMIEAELFGFSKGAFTGAMFSNVGLFRTADKGTLFLDEIGDLPLGLQRKLLRVIDTGEVRPVGSNEVIQVDVRVVSATHRDIAQMVLSGNFRDDLFFRIAGAEFSIPPLCDHPEDIPVLANCFLSELSVDDSIQARYFSEQALRFLQQCKWPGNVRELKNFVEYCSAISRSTVIDEVLVNKLFKGEKTYSSLVDVLRTFEFEHLAYLLKLTGGKVEEVSKLIGKSRSSTYRLLSSVGIDPTQYRQ